MERLFSQQINKMVASGRFSSENELHVYVMLLITAATAGLMHVLLFVSMFAIGVYPLAVINIGSIFSYIIMYGIVKFKRAYFAAGLLIAVEVMIYIPLAVYFIGMNTFGVMLYFVLIFMEWNVPYTSTRNVGVLTVIIWFAVMGTLVLGVLVPPVYPILQPSAVLILSIFHINLTFAGLAVVLFVTMVVRTTIAASTAALIKKYKAQATVDALTELPNRRSADLFIAELAESEPARDWCVAMLDIDDFKQVNDTLGHAAGDDVLRTLARTLSSTLRRTDMVFRWGGEEFLLFLADADLNTAKGFLEKLRISIGEHPISSGEHSIPITVTIGLARVDIRNIRDSIDQSDQRLYDGKRSGKNKVVTE